MAGHLAEQVDVGGGRDPGTRPEDFITAFRSGTGGHRIAVLADRIVTYCCAGGTSQLPLAAIDATSTFESGSSQPAFGVLFETRSPRHTVGYRFEDDATRRAFMRAVQGRIGRDAALVGDRGATGTAHGAGLWGPVARR